MDYKVCCCNKPQVGRVFYLPSKNCTNRILVFLDECQICGNSKALIVKADDKGVYNKAIISRSGAKALQMLNRLNLTKPIEFKVQKGSKENMAWLWFDGSKDFWVRDFNGTKVLKISI